MKMHRVVAVAVVALLAGCARQLPKSEQFTSTERSQQSLTFDPTGVTVDENGRRLLWDSQRGLVTATAPHELILDTRQAISSAVIEDVVSMPNNRVGVIARNEGRVIDLGTKAVVSRFCYLPGSLPQPNPTPENPQPTLSQLSRSIAFGVDEGRIYVQPQTFQDARAIDTQLGQFEIGNEQPLDWQQMEELEGIAGGMVITKQNRMLIGLGTRIYEYDALGKRWVRGLDLSGRLVSIEGLAIDRTTNSLLVLDGPGRRLLEFDVP
ncbi:MAG: hypothetical protein JNM17_17600 [Archangium sp.]|nr:hypothetical protein [Archangium sp.]